MSTLLPKANTTRKTILGISLGTRMLGIARLEGTSLNDWRVKTVTGRLSKLKLRTIILFIERYCKDNQVTTIALKVPEQSSRALNVLIKEITGFAKDEHIGLHLYTITELKRHYQKKNKLGVMEYVTEAYPEVKVIYQKQKKAKNPYYIKLFEAVCTAEYCGIKEE